MYVVILPGASHNTSCRVLDGLVELLHQAVTDAVQQAVAVIKADTDECMHQRFSRIWSQYDRTSRSCLSWKKARPTERRNVIGHA